MIIQLKQKKNDKEVKYPMIYLTQSEIFMLFMGKGDNFISAFHNENSTQLDVHD